MDGALPTMVVVGAMKCGTTALHRYLAAHPDIAMAPAKEVNFFVGPDTDLGDPATAWRRGQWHRGVQWYASLFDPQSPVRGETSPGYTSPDHAEAPVRLAALLPHARLLYLVRDPVERAASQYRHHTREGAERRPMGEALVDPASHYVMRSRYVERLEPYLRLFPREQLQVVVAERLLKDRRQTLRAVFEHVGADARWWSSDLEHRWHVGDRQTRVPARLHERVREWV